MQFCINGREYTFNGSKLGPMTPKRFIEFLMNCGISIKRFVLRDITNPDSNICRELKQKLANQHNTSDDWTMIFRSVVNGTVTYIEVERACIGGAQELDGRPTFVG